MRSGWALWIGLALLVAAPANAHLLAYRIDSVHSQILFSTGHNGYSYPVGRLAIARGWLQFDPNDWAASKVVLDIDTASADLGDKGWDHAVTGRSFLDAGHYPLAHFASDKVTRTGTSTGVIEGALTLRGITQPVTITFTVNRVGMTMFGFETIAGFSGRATLDRRRFGMTAFPHAIGTDVALRFELEAQLDRDAKAQYQQAVEHADADAPH